MAKKQADILALDDKGKEPYDIASLAGLIKG